MPSLRRTIATSPHPLAKLARTIYYGIDRISIPAPRFVVVPTVSFFSGLTNVYRFFKRVVVAEPFFKSKCRSYGRNVHTGGQIHYFQGAGDIILGDDIRFDGKSTFQFAARFADRPTLEVGDGTIVGHQCGFTVGKRITIGRRCLLSTGIWIFDTNGHPTDPAARWAGLAPSAEDVKPVTIGDNVWIGRNCTIFPGVTVGTGSIISTGSIVRKDVAPYTVVAGNPAKEVAVLTPVPLAEPPLETSNELR
jgi:acetyltransferase-like isoleucine patch superfamily enzyme